MNDPTPALDALVEQGVRPRVEYLSGLIAEIIGCDPADQRVLRCVASVQAQTSAVPAEPDRHAARPGEQADAGQPERHRRSHRGLLAGRRPRRRPRRACPLTRPTRGCARRHIRPTGSIPNRAAATISSSSAAAPRGWSARWAPRASARASRWSSAALLGGDCLNTGCVPSKALLRSARAAAEARRARRASASASPGVDADFAAVMRRMRERRADISPHDSAARLRAAGVDVYFGDARFTGRVGDRRRRPDADVPPRGDRDRRPSRRAADPGPRGACRT